MRHAERYQLSLDFATKADDEPLLYPAPLGALRMLNSRELTLNRFVRSIREPITVRSPLDVANYLMANVFTPFSTFTQEEMWVLLVNTRNRITHDALVYRGTLNSAMVRIGELFKEAIHVNAASIILSHNHPSGDPTPSPEDVLLTDQAHRAGRLLDIDLLDHIIVGDNRWFSLKEHGLGFSGTASDPLP